MFEWIVYAVLIALFLVLMVTGWIMYVFAAFMGYLVLAFIAEGIKNYLIYKGTYYSSNDK